MTTTVNATAGDWNGTHTTPVVFDATTMASIDGDYNNSTMLPDASTTLAPHPHDSIWLMSASAQGIAGVFVWAAVFITCHQVCYHCLKLCYNFHIHSPFCFYLADISISEILHSPF